MRTATRFHGDNARRQLRGETHNRLGLHSPEKHYFPAASNPATLQLFLPRSIPNIMIVMARPSPFPNTSILADAFEEGGPFHKTLLASEQDRPDIRWARQEWQEKRQPRMRLEPHRLVFIDETGTTTKMARLRGRCLKGRRLRAKAPFGHWKTQTFIAGLRCDGLTAPFVVDTPKNRRIFETYVETQLAPTLLKGDVVILDNLAAHKSIAAEKAIRAKGAWMLFLPPYSPDLNPIEMASAKLKQHLRAKAIRTIDALWQAIGVTIAHETRTTFITATSSATPSPTARLIVHRTTKFI